MTGSCLIVVSGPTAVGKSDLGSELASRFGGEIVSADSRQVYRGMELGTAAPTAAQRSRVPHHLVGYVEPDEPYDVARFQRDADAALAAIARRGKPAFLVGGSYHYLQAVLERLSFPGVAAQPELRRAWEREAAQLGPQALHARLAALDPEAAAGILPGNLRRTMRALEVLQVTGRRFSELGRRRGPTRPALRLALTCPRAELYRRIDDRIDDMLRDGWLDEVRRLLERGYSPALSSMSGSGYPELAAAIRGDVPLDVAVQRAKYSTHAYARRQYAWLRRDRELVWLERGADLQERAGRLVETYLAAAGAA